MTQLSMALLAVLAQQSVDLGSPYSATTQHNRSHKSEEILGPNVPMVSTFYSVLQDIL